MQLGRMFSAEKYKGTRNYLNTQRKYEILRTILFFGISISLFLAGWITTKSKENLLTVVAILGCLPACKSAVGAFMYVKYHSCSEEVAQCIEEHSGELTGLYDLVFTSYEKNYQVAHIAIRGNTLCGYTEDPKFDERTFYKHLDGMLKNDGFKDATVKIFTDLKKYSERLAGMQTLEEDTTHTQGIVATLKSISL